MAVQPVTDPEVCQALADSIERNSARSRTARGVPGWKYGHEEGHVPGRWFSRLESLAARLGYRVLVRDLYSLSCWGATWGPLGDDALGVPPRTIVLNEDMSKTSAARVFGHELSHVLLNHIGATPAEARQIATRRLAYGKDPHEEAQVELAAAAVCDVAGVPATFRSPAYIRESMKGQPVTRRDKDAALLAARCLWPAVSGSLN